MISAETFTRIPTTEVSAHVGEHVTICGWLHAMRRLGGLSFLTLRDGWGTLQIVAEGDNALAPLASVGAGVESVIGVTGVVCAAPQAPGGLELREPHIEVITPVTEPLPLAINKRELKASLPTILDHAPLANRNPQRRATLRLAAGVMAGFRETLAARGFTEIQTPKINAAAAEGGANVFALDYFGRNAYLAQSPQLYKQMLVGVFERVFEVGPVFRAEPHDTTRHLNEYVSLDLEMGFIRDHHDVMAMLREALAGIFGVLAVRHTADLALLGVTLPAVPSSIPAIDFVEAQELIYQRHGLDVRGEPDLSPQDERWLGEWAQSEHGSDFLFVTGYPLAKRPFYTHPDPARPQYTNSFDLLFRGTELVTGGQRLHRYADYLAALGRLGLSPEPFAAYLEAFRYGMPPHGGFGMGMERLLEQLLGASSIKLVTLFPRDLHRLTP